MGPRACADALHRREGMGDRSEAHEPDGRRGAPSGSDDLVPGWPASRILGATQRADGGHTSTPLMGTECGYYLS